VQHAGVFGFVLCH